MRLCHPILESRASAIVYENLAPGMFTAKKATRRGTIKKRVTKRKVMMSIPGSLVDDESPILDCRGLSKRQMIVSGVLGALLLILSRGLECFLVGSLR